MPAARLRLLVVEDDPMLRESFTLVFRQLGHEVRSAEDGFSALSEMREELPDLVVSDLNMPRMSGFELLSVVRRRFPAVPVIAMSGAFSGDRVPPGVAADGFFQKGSGVGRLLKAVGTVFELKRSSLPPSRPEADLDFATRMRFCRQSVRHHCLPGVLAFLSPGAGRFDELH